MKRIYLALMLTIGLISGSVTAQIEEGVIKAKQTFDTDDPELKGQLAMLGEMTSTVFVKGNKTRVEQSGGMSGTNITIMDGDSKKGLILMDNPMLGKKYVTVDESDQEDEDLESEQDVDIEKTDETKEIMGYECTKYIVYLDEGEVTIYATEDIESASDGKYGQYVDGAILMWEAEQNQMGMQFTIIYEVVEIKEKKVDDDKFDMTVPDGYEETTMDALKSMGG